MTTHWAADIHDRSRTGCNLLVGYVLAELGQEVSPRPEAVDCKGCQEFLDAADEYANQQEYREERTT